MPPETPPTTPPTESQQPPPQHPPLPDFQPYSPAPAFPHKALWGGLAAALGIVAAGSIWLFLLPSPHAATPATTKSPSPSASAVAGLQLDPHHNYGDKYASGLLPVGDN